MFSLIKQVFIVLLGFSESLAKQYLFLNDDPCMVRPTLIDVNPVELKCYPFMISLVKCAESFKDLSPKICVQSMSIKIKPRSKSSNLIMYSK